MLSVEARYEGGGGGMGTRWGQNSAAYGNHDVCAIKVFLCCKRITCLKIILKPVKTCRSISSPNLHSNCGWVDGGHFHEFLISHKETEPQRG